MGFRTVVVLSNDFSHEWENDPALGKKIMHSAVHRDHHFQYGQVVEQVHGDQQTLAVLDGYGGEAVAFGGWHTGQTKATRDVDLLKDLARRLGYRVSKNPKAA